jgi:hypothetical protein
VPEDDWEQERRHREILDGQREATRAAEAAGREAAKASLEVADELRQTREFQIFWDTLTFEEKREWRQQYEEEQRLQAEARRLAELQRIEEARIAAERRAHLERVRAIAALDGRYGWISIPAAIGMLVVALFFEGLVLREIWLFAVAALLSAVGVVLLAAKIARRKWTKDVDRNKKNESSFYSENQVEIDKAAENPPAGAKFTLPKLVVVLTVAMYIHFTLGVFVISMINERITIESDKSSISKIIHELSGTSGAELISYLDKVDFDKAFYKQGADWASSTQAVKFSNYQIQLEFPKEEFEVVPTDDRLKSTSCTQGGWDATSFRNYWANIRVNISSDWSTPTLSNLEIFFMADGDGVYAMLDPCELKYPGAVFFDPENTAYSIMTDLSAQGFYSKVICPEQMAGRKGQKLYCSLSPALEPFTRIEITIVDALEGTYSWRTVE